MTHKQSIRDSLAYAEWEEIIRMMERIEPSLDKEGVNNRKLRTQIGLVKLLMCSKMRTFNGDNTIEMSFFVASHKTIKKLEESFEKHNVKNRELIIFLKLILHKMSKQKLKVKKHKEIKDEFSRMKGVVENGHSTL